MQNEIELERTFLVKKIPEKLESCKSKKLVDIYIPRKAGHAAVRIRQQGDKFYVTKKTKVGSANELREETIEITEEDFEIFKSMKKASIVEKTRYYFPTEQGTAEIDVFEGKLKGLVLADIEFKSMEELTDSKMPDFCLIDVTDKDFIAGGALCNSSYAELESKLKEIGYKKLNFDN